MAKQQADAPELTPEQVDELKRQGFDLSRIRIVHSPPPASDTTATITINLSRVLPSDEPLY